MKKIFTISAILLAFGMGAFAQSITGIVVTNPPPPDAISECDQVEITINGTFPATNYTNTNFVPDFNGYQLDYNLYAESQGVGSPTVTPFSEPVPTLGFLQPAGTYTLTIFFYNNGNLVDTFVTTLEVEVGEDPDPGIDAFIEVCTTDPPFNLYDQLGGTPEAGGEWTDPNNNIHPGVFNPQSDPPGLYLYNLFAFPPCNPTFSTVTIVFTPNSDPGQNGVAFLCELEPPVDLFDYLGGTPQTGGTWTKPGGGAHSGILDPSSDPPGNYKYTVTGQAPCGDPFALVNAMIQPGPQPGMDNSITVFDNDPPFTLYDHLLGTPDTNGTWVDPNDINFGPWNAMMNPTLDFPGTYKYVAVSLPCPLDTAFLDVEVLVGINESDPNINSMDVIPNPTDGNFRLDMSFRSAADEYQLEILNMSGQAVLSENLATSGKMSFQQNMDLTHLPKGVYFLRLASGSATTVKRVILE